MRLEEILRETQRAHDLLPRQVHDILRETQRIREALPDTSTFFRAAEATRSSIDRFGALAFLQEADIGLVAGLGLDGTASRDRIHDVIGSFHPWPRDLDAALTRHRDMLFDQVHLPGAIDAAQRLSDLGQSRSFIDAALRAEPALHVSKTLQSLNAFSLDEEVRRLSQVADLLGDNPFAREARRIFESGEALAAAELIRQGALERRFAQHASLFEANLDGSAEGWAALAARLTEIGDKLGPVAQASFVNLMLRKFLVALVFALLAGGAKHELCEGFGHLVPEIFEVCGDVKKTIKQIDLRLALSFDVEDLADWRIVVAKSYLNVRAAGRMNAEIVDRLYPGAVVSLQTKSENKAWALVEYRDPLSQQVRTGWVSARYLKKIGRRSRLTRAQMDFHAGPS